MIRRGLIFVIGGEKKSSIISSMSLPNPVDFLFNFQ